MEPVDDTFRPVPPGELSHTVLVTNLANRVQPLIRYNLGDRVQLAAGPCACGSPFPALRVEGRSGGVLSFAAADGASSKGQVTGQVRDGTASDGKVVTVLPLALGTVIEETAGVRRFQAIRTGPRLAHRAARALAGCRDGGRADGGGGAAGCVLRGPGRRRRRRPV